LLIGSGGGQDRMFKSGCLVAFYFLSAEQRVFLQDARLVVTLRDFLISCLTF
jgi:hypothetical protein